MAPASEFWSWLYPEFAEIFAAGFLVFQVADLVCKKLTLGQIDAIELAVPFSRLAAYSAVAVVRRAARAAKLFPGTTFHACPIKMILAAFVCVPVMRQRCIFAAPAMLTLK